MRYMDDAVGILRAYVMPAVVALGLLGNLTTMAIFLLENAGRKRWTRFAVYGIAIAATDTFALVFNTFLDDFLGRGLNYASNGAILVKIDTISSVTCKLMEYIPSVAYFTSSYLLIIFSLDRTLTIFRPLQFMSHFHVKATVLIVGLTYFCGLALMMPMAVIHDIQLQNTSKAGSQLERKCELQAQSSVYHSLSRVMLYFMTFGSFVVPSLVVCLLGVVIVVKLSIIRRNRASILPTAADNQMEMSRFYAHLTLAVAYCVLVLPLAISICMRQVFENSPHEYQQQHKQYAAFLRDTSRFTSSVKDLNYALNFWVYLIFVRSFRRRSMLVLSQMVVAFRCHRVFPSSGCCQRAEERVRRLRESKGKSIKSALYRHRSHIATQSQPVLALANRPTDRSHPAATQRRRPAAKDSSSKDCQELLTPAHTEFTVTSV